MHMMQDRRRFLTTLSSAGAAGLVGTPTSFAQEAPPETTTIRLTNIPGICIAPQYVAEELLKSEGFTDVQYVDVVNTDIYPAFASSTVDISMAFVAPFIVQIDRKVPIVLPGRDSCRMLRAVRAGACQGNPRPEGQGRCRAVAGLAPPYLCRQHGGPCRPRPQQGHQFCHPSRVRIGTASRPRGRSMP